MTLYKERLSNCSDEGSQMANYLEGSQMSKLCSSEEMELMDMHDYANPQELKKSIEQIDGVKKTNLIYEPLPPRNKTNGFTKGACSPSSYNKEILLKNKKNFMKERFQRFLIVVIILMSLGSFTLSVLTTFGVTQANCNKALKEEYIPISKSHESLKGGHAVDVEKFKELQNNITYLKKMLTSLQNQVKFLESNHSVSKTFELQGPRGPPGPPGEYYLKKCEYRTKIGSAPYNEDINLSVVEITIPIIEKTLIIGVTCMGGDESGLFHENTGDKSVYKCKCAGAAKTPLFINKELKCRAHFWECPVEK